MRYTFFFFLFLQGISHCINGQVIDCQQISAKYFNEDAQWYVDNIPFFECSDTKIQDVYYYRWKLYKAHIRNVGEDGYVITEFLDNTSWDKDPYSSLNDATAFHIYEGRWLKDKRYLNGYIDYLYRGGGNDRHFSEGISDAAYAHYLINADSAFIVAQLPVMQHVYKLWLDHYDLSKNLYYIEPLLDATEYTISSIDATNGRDGFTGGHAFRPTINSYMYANALAIAHIAKLHGDSLLCYSYLKKAKQLKETIQNNLWNDSFHHFTDRYFVNNQYVHYWDFIRGRELAGYVPWCFNLPDNNLKYNEAWLHIVDTTQLMGKQGLRTVEPSYPYYMKQYRYEGAKPECQWNGPSWPFQTSQALIGMANLLNNYTQSNIRSSDYLKILRQYTQQHYYANNQLNLQEDYNADTGKPIVGLARSSHYNHSEYNDLIITGLCGIRPSEGNVLEIHPLIDNSIRFFCLDKVDYHGYSITVVYDVDGTKYKFGKGLTVFVNGDKKKLIEKNGSYSITLGAPVVSKLKPTLNQALNIWRKSYPIPSASVNSVPDSLYQAVDGRAWYFPEIKNRWTTLGTTSLTNWYVVNFGESRSVSSVKLCFYADGELFEKPDNYTIEYWNGLQWLPVKEITRKPLSPLGNTANEVHFENVNTTQVRANFRNNTLQYSVALCEFEIY